MRPSPGTPPPPKLDEDELLSSPDGEATDSFLQASAAAALNTGNLSDELTSFGSEFGSDEEIYPPQSVPSNPGHIRPHSSYASTRAKLACMACRR